MKRLYVFYDPDCGLCAGVRRWMEGEEAFLDVRFVPFDSEPARDLCPDLLARGGDREIVVMADDGRLWQGGDAWIVCLWTLRRWRRWSHRLAGGTLRPLARRLCHLISSKRLTLSHLLRLTSDRELAALAEATPVSECGSDGCALVRAKTQSRKEVGR